MATGSSVLAVDNALNGTEEDDAVTIISVFRVGEPFAYNVPSLAGQTFACNEKVSFPAFTPQVGAMKYRLCGGDGEKLIYHGVLAALVCSWGAYSPYFSQELQ